MMRLPIPAILAALVVVAAGSVLLNVYFKSDVPYDLNVTDIPYMQNKTFVLDYMPYRIRFVSNIGGAWYYVNMYVNGTVNVGYKYGAYIYWFVCHNVCSFTATNDTAIFIEPVDIRGAKVKIFAIRTWPP